MLWRCRQLNKNKNLETDYVIKQRKNLHYLPYINIKSAHDDIESRYIKQNQKKHYLSVCAMSMDHEFHILFLLFLNFSLVAAWPTLVHN